MTPDDRLEFRRLLAKLMVVFPQQRLTRDEQDLREEAYWEALVPYDLDEIGGAVRDAIRDNKFFPTPAELISLIRSERRRREGYDDPSGSRVRTPLIHDADAGAHSGESSRDRA